VDAVLREQTLARFEQHRRAWQGNAALRTLYGRWYARVRQALPDRNLGPWIELGSGPGLAKEAIAELELSDVVRAPWHDHQAAAEALPWPDSSVGALVLFDVLHHLRAPADFFSEAVRVLCPGGRIVLCEPYVSALSLPVYKLFHDERTDLRVDALAGSAVTAEDPFEGNQAIPTLLFGPQRPVLEARFPALHVKCVEYLAGPAYPASGGFSRRPLLPPRLWRALLAIEDHLPAFAFRLVGFRLLAVLERVGAAESKV
jgi:SAM-dependent methyltransferase